MTAPLDAWASLAACRHELDRVRRLRARGRAGAADVHAAEHRLHLALLEVDRRGWPGRPKPDTGRALPPEFDGIASEHAALPLLRWPGGG